MFPLFTLGTKIGVKIEHYAPIEPGSELYRIIFRIYTNPTVGDHKLIKFYEVWVSATYAEDKLGLKREPAAEEILQFSKKYLVSRYKDSGDTVPPEDGAFLTNQTGEVFGNPSQFPLKIPDRSEPVKTTIMLPKETHKWLKVYALENETGLSEVIRRIVMSFVEGKKREWAQQDSK